ncbi:hypothetical protein QOT17_017202 [Balamuthia mandrillaris]
MEADGSSSKPPKRRLAKRTKRGLRAKAAASSSDATCVNTAPSTSSREDKEPIPPTTKRAHPKANTVTSAPKDLIEATTSPSFSLSSSCDQASGSLLSVQELRAKYKDPQANKTLLPQKCKDYLEQVALRLQQCSSSSSSPNEHLQQEALELLQDVAFVLDMHQPTGVDLRGCLEQLCKRFEAHAPAALYFLYHELGLKKPSSLSAYHKNKTTTPSSSSSPPSSSFTTTSSASSSSTSLPPSGATKARAKLLASQASIAEEELERAAQCFTPERPYTHQDYLRRVEERMRTEQERVKKESERMYGSPLPKRFNHFTSGLINADKFLRQVPVHVLSSPSPSSPSSHSSSTPTAKRKRERAEEIETDIAKVEIAKEETGRKKKTTYTPTKKWSTTPLSATQKEKEKEEQERTKRRRISGAAAAEELEGGSFTPIVRSPLRKTPQRRTSRMMRQTNSPSVTDSEALRKKLFFFAS